METYVKTLKELSAQYLAEMESIQSSEKHKQLKILDMENLRRWYDRQYDYLIGHGEQV